MGTWFGREKKPAFLSIDLETRSEVDLPKCGVYKYVEGEFWKILLFCYLFEGDEDVSMVDMASGEELPEEVLSALEDPDIVKYAWNASFERTNLSTYLGRRLDPRQWRCTMVWAAELSLPLSLKNAAAALKVEQQKDRAGDALIRKFSVPQKPTKSNGMKTWLEPWDLPEQWEAFKSYCKQDVRTEDSIRRRLERFPVPMSEWEMYWIDQDINDRGIKIDLDLARAAMECDRAIGEKMMARAKELTGLENPNSIQQMQKWLQAHGVYLESLGKELVQEQIAEMEKDPDADKEALEMLKLRLMMSKSSVKKYEAAVRCTCKDGRARGLFQFYGANRTGRFCLTGDHEVLTEDGWVRLDEWEGGKIACWNPIGEIVAFQDAEALCFDYTGEMYDYEDVRISQVSTPDHKMWCQKYYGAKWQQMTVADMAKGKPVIPMAGCLSARPVYDANKLRIILMTQADGFYTDDGSLAFNFRKERKIERCKRLLRSESIWFSESTYGNGYKTTKILVPRRYIPIWLRMFKKKELGWWILGEDASVIFDELPFWDGSRVAGNSIQYTSTNKKNADILQALAHINGMCASMVVKKNSERHENWNDAYVLNIWEKPGIGHVIATKPTIKEFSGKVYCASTKSGYFLVRRNGKVWVTGNSGRNIQLQNLSKNYISYLSEARSLVKAGAYEALDMLCGNVPDILSQCVRTMLVPKEGHEFIVADFSAIEARCIAWEAGEKSTLQDFRDGKDLYCATASRMFGVPVVKHGENGELRQKGKIAVLACGYGGSAGAMAAMGALKMGLTQEELPGIVQAYRDANPHIVGFWWNLDEAAMKCIKDHQTHVVGEANPDSPKLVEFEFGRNVLWMKLPSGRRLAYVAPKIGKNRFGGKAIEFQGVGMNNNWQEMETYGAKLSENATQAIARDILCNSIKNLEAEGIQVVAHVHDECICEVPIGKYTVDDICEIMARNPEWCKDLPLTAAGYLAPDYYFKD